MSVPPDPRAELAPGEGPASASAALHDEEHGSARLGSARLGSARLGSARSRGHHGRRGHHWLLLAGLGVVVVILAVAAAAGLHAWPRARLEPAAGALARLEQTGAHGTLQSASASYDGHVVALVDHGGALLPAREVPVDTRMDVTVELRRPSWISWLAGRTTRLTMTVRTPYARLVDSVVDTRPGQPVLATFSAPVREVAITTSSLDPVEHLAQASTSAAVLADAAQGSAGSALVTAVPELWESFPAPQRLSYFVTASPAPMAIVAPPALSSSLGISSRVDITLSQPISSVFGSKLPSFVPDIQGAPVPAGRWSEPTPNSLEFTPSGPAFWPGEQLQLRLPAAVTLGGSASTKAVTTLAVEGASGSYLRLEQMLAHLGYLPLSWAASDPSVSAFPTGTAAEVALIDAPPQGTFSWRWSFPSELTSLWSPSSANVITEGAIMTFEQVEGLNTDGEANPLLWQTLLQAVVAQKMDPHPYTWIQVSMQLPETLWLWSDGHVVLSNLTNTGIPQTPTATGTYPIYERFPFNYMSGYNPNGSYYHDPVYWINYFNGGDAVHGFVRASYGFPQSLGCVELPIPVAAQVYPQVHIGTLVTVE